MIRLVASDIDGTLLHGEEREISPAVFAQIRRLRAKGILFCPASGRQYSSLRRLFAPVAGELSYLCENGAVVYGPGDPGPVLGRTPMPRGRALELCRPSWPCPVRGAHLRGGHQLSVPQGGGHRGAYAVLCGEQRDPSSPPQSRSRRRS